MLERQTLLVFFTALFPAPGQYLAHNECLYLFTRAVLTKDYRLKALNNRK